MGLQLAEVCLRANLSVCLLAVDAEQVPDRLRQACPVYSACPSGLRAAFDECTQGRGFHLLMANMHSWTQRFDFQVVQVGGSVVDFDDPCKPVSLPPHVDRLVRTDLQSFLSKPRSAEDAIALAVHKSAWAKSSQSPSRSEYC